MSEYKICEVCGQEKHISDFSKSYKRRCKKCVALQMKAQRNKKNAVLHKAIEKVMQLENKLSGAIQQVESILVFQGFDDYDLPNASMCCGGELILEYHGSEIYTNSIIHCMEARGYIIPDDFLHKNISL